LTTLSIFSPCDIEYDDKLFCENDNNNNTNNNNNNNHTLQTKVIKKMKQKISKYMLVQIVEPNIPS